MSCWWRCCLDLSAGKQRVYFLAWESALGMDLERNTCTPSLCSISCQGSIVRAHKEEAQALQLLWVRFLWIAMMQVMALRSVECSHRSFQTTSTAGFGCIQSGKWNMGEEETFTPCSQPASTEQPAPLLAFLHLNKPWDWVKGTTFNPFALCRTWGDKKLMLSMQFSHFQNCVNDVCLRS